MGQRQKRHQEIDKKVKTLTTEYYRSIEANFQETQNITCSEHGNHGEALQ